LRENEAGSRLRLDKTLKDSRQDLSWRQIREAIEKGQVTVDGRTERDPGLDVRTGASVELNLNRPAQSRARASFEILHEDDHIIVLNKPAGLLSIPSGPEAAASEDTVLRRVREYMQFRRGHKTYVGMLHRLDRETSGALAVALSKDAHAAGREMFKEHRFERHYLALVHGIPDPPQGTIRARISNGYFDGRRKLVGPDAPGLDAETDYTVREKFIGAALVELRLHTGRQHQIRLHLEKLGHPLLGEKVYQGQQADGRTGQQANRPTGEQANGRTGQRAAKRNMLHAWTLAFPHPISGIPIDVEAPLPQDFKTMLHHLSNASARQAGPSVSSSKRSPSKR
jgi:23S rRNA pseudouridine1911/1915/1917 synthase